MAERRMFARSITCTARFLRLPARARLLYYDLGMEADDDGCVDAYGVLMRTGAGEDDLHLLVEKGLVRFLIEEDLVVYIADWRRNNLIRHDRYHPGLYHDMVCQMEAQMQEQRKNEEKTAENTGDSFLVNQRLTEVREDKASQVQSSSGKASQEQDSPACGPSGAEPILPSCLPKEEAVDEIRRVEARYDLPDRAEAVWAYFSQNGWRYKDKPVPNLANAALRWHRNVSKGGPS